MSKQTIDKHVITYETKSGNTWKEQTLSLPTRVRVGAVLKEMRAQDVIRNVQLIQAASC
jgi:hypothetical protein